MYLCRPFTILTLTALPIVALSPVSASAAAPSIPLTVNVSEAVNVDTTGGIPRIVVDVGGVARYAPYNSGSGTNTLTFTYTATVGDIDLDGISLTSPIDLNGGTVKDISGNNATLTYTLPNTSGIKIDYPSISMNFANGSDGRYTFNDNVYNSVSSFLSAVSGTFSRSSIGTYFDSSGTMQTAAANALRFDYDPTTHVFKGALFEEARTNYMKNSTMVGAIAGSPGTVPTGWVLNSPGGGATVTSTIVGTGTISGMKYIDIRSQGNLPATGGFINVANFDLTTTTSISNTTYLAGSMRLQLLNGTIPSNMTYVVSEQNGATYLANRTMFAVSSATSIPTLQYFSGSATAVNSSVTNFVAPRLVIGSTGTATAFDFTLRIATPQVEISTYPTSFIPTTTAVVTRNVDQFIIPTGSWYNTTQGSMAGDFSWQSSTGTLFPMIFRFDVSGGSTDRWDIYYAQNSNKIGMDGFTGGVSQGGYIPTAVSGTSGSAKAGMALAENNVNMALSGTLGTVDTSWNVPTVNQFSFSSTNGANRWIRTFKYYPQRIADQQLKILTQ